MSSAQSLSFSLFGRYLDSLREQAAIPGLSAAIVQGGRVVWEEGFGVLDIDSAAPALPDTPYPVGDLTQTFAAVLLAQCVDRGTLDIDSPIRVWTAAIEEREATVRHVLAHASDGRARGGFRYDPARYATLTSVAEACADQPYRSLLDHNVLSRLGMAESVPGTDLQNPSTAARDLFDRSTLDRYAALLRRTAAPHRLDRGGKASRSSFPSSGLDASTGLVSTVRDLARYDAALDDGILVRRDVLDIGWRNAVTESGSVLPTGLGWFVQTYDGKRLVWHFGSVPDAFSSLMLKVPDRDLTLILLANSDGLSSTFRLHEGDVTTSLFARLFLRMFV